jgi:chemotaxis signal transduction protein
MTEQHSKQFGIVQIGQTFLGIPIEHLSEVFHGSKQEALPGRGDLLQGGVELRGRLVPLLNLKSMAGLEYNTSKPKLGVILEHERKVLAFFVDDIVGIAMVSAEQIQDLTDAQSCDTTLFGSVFADNGRFVSLLDVPRTFSAPNVFSAKQPDIIQKSTKRTLQPMLTFQAGKALYAVPAIEVYAAIPKQVIARSAVTMGSCLGEINYHGRRIPVVCPVSILGLGTVTTHTITEVVALRFPGDLVIGFAVDAIHEIGTFSTEKITSIPIWQSGRNFVDKVVIRNNDEQIYMIDLEQLHAAQDLLDISSLSEHTVDVDEETKLPATQQNVIWEKERYLVVDAPFPLAIPLSEVNCILEQPNRLTPTSAADRGFRGYFTRFNESIALFDLCECIRQRPVEETTGKVLLTGKSGHQIGFLVDHVDSIETSEWREKRPQDSTDSSMALVQLGTGKQAKVLPFCNLMSTIRKDLPNPVQDAIPHEATLAD